MLFISALSEVMRMHVEISIDSISSNSPTQLEIKDTINEGEVFIKVMNGLVMTLLEDKRFLCVWLLYYVTNFGDSRANGGAKISIKSYSMRFFFPQCI